MCSFLKCFEETNWYVRQTTTHHLKNDKLTVVWFERRKILYSWNVTHVLLCDIVISLV